MDGIPSIPIRQELLGEQIADLRMKPPGIKNIAFQCIKRRAINFARDYLVVRCYVYMGIGSNTLDHP